ncbi:NAD-dependent epimerase/dehydratase family protein [Croceicoccus marinus]|uniref:NAD(P)-dependent oxidoreductase n=1 Tax=Croceicoccus marinus TaxID=450378 RepID=A0A7G6VUT8_9SPHN|nr:NAD(P)-dependent oxidoreductase [Croceicoccus marinus]QNE05503.1 NAD(P)-dependent oxidoreductase [Croceicoccus marinus]
MHQVAPVMVTGASGFVGRAVVRALRMVGRGSGRPVVALGTRPADAPRDEYWEPVDLLDPAAVQDVLARHRPAALIHAAWARSRAGGLWNAPDNMDWRDASMALFEAFWQAGGKHVVGCGSCAEYAISDDPCREDATPIAPESLYGQAKAQLHGMAAARAGALGGTLAWARIFYLFGPHEAAARLVPSVIDSLLRGEPALTGSGLTRRDFALIGDVGHGIASLAETGAIGAYNVASGEAVRLRDLVERIGAIMERLDLVRIGALPDRPDEAPLIAADVGKIARDTGWHARTPLDEALRQTIEWRREHAISRSDDRKRPAKL